MSGIDVDDFERENSDPLTICEKLELAFAAVAMPLALLMIALLSGCATKTCVVDGTGVQANQYTGLTVFSGSMRNIAQGMEFMETYEDVSTSWWNFGRYNYKRYTTYASSSTNEPPEHLAAAFQPCVDTSALFVAEVSTNRSGNVVQIVAEGTLGK